MLAPDASAAGQVVLTARSDNEDPAEALREALRAIAAQLGNAGAGPHHLTRMTFAAPNPAAFHPSRRPIDLVWREAFAGFRPKLSLIRADERALVITAHAAVPGPPDPHPIWRTYSAQQLALQY